MELGRVQLGEELILRDGLSFAYEDLEDAAAGLEGQVGLGGLDGSGVGKLSLPRLLLPAVDEEARADEERQHDDDDDAFLQGTPPRYKDGLFHTIFPLKR